MPLKDVKSLQPNKVINSDKQVGMEINFYTDPLCCWTWAMQSQWALLMKDLKGQELIINYKMGGLLPSWKHFNDNVNSIQKPVQMGPEWSHARAVSGAEINDRIWITDPPASSFPACIAVKSVEMQSLKLAAAYLQVLQAAVMVKNLNISKRNILEDLAIELTKIFPEFDLNKFKEDLVGDQAKEAFRKDLQECKYLNITRLPTIRFKSPNNHSVVITGYQSYESLKNACLSARPLLWR